MCYCVIHRLNTSPTRIITINSVEIFVMHLPQSWQEEKIQKTFAKEKLRT